jgi:hypothetical protein
MPAKLIVIAGEPSGTEFDIQDEVLRIGSGTQCEFRLSELAPHAATLEYRDGTYFLHNRSDAMIALGRDRLGLRDSAAWSPGMEANLGHGLTLRLDVEGDPAPAKPARPTYTIEYDAEEPVEDGQAAAKKPAGSSKKTLQIAIIVVAVPLCIWMLLSDNEPPKADPAEKRVSFTEVIDKLADSPVDKERGSQSIRAALQRARSAELHGDRKAARQAYGFVRDTLVIHRKPDGNFRDPEDEMVWSYVKQRLRVVQGGELTP